MDGGRKTEDGRRRTIDERRCRTDERERFRRTIIVHRPWSIVAVLCVSLAALLQCARTTAAADKPEWWNKAWRYRAIVGVPAAEPAAYRLWIYTGDRARPDGSDMRVVNPMGKVIPLGIVCSTAARRHLITFRDTLGDRGKPPIGPYAIYFGNEGATAFTGAPPDRGLILETRAIPPPESLRGERKDPGVSDWKAAAETLNKAHTLYGLDYWSEVFDACNPFGPQADYISVYRGFIECPKAGAYKFATLSDDASFLFIDDTLVAQWPGRDHEIQGGRHGEHGGEIKLEAGRHKLRYVGFAFGGPKRMEAAWMPPDRKWFEKIPPSAFLGLPPANVVEWEDSTRPVCAGFTADPAQYLEIGQAPQYGNITAGQARMVAVQFTSLSSAAGGAVRSHAWDFGDGQTSAERNPVHVFLSPRRYDVKLTVTSASGEADTFALRLDVAPVWNDLSFPRDKMDRFWNWTRDYAVGKLSTEHLLAFHDLVAEVDQRARSFDICVELDKRRREMTPAQVFSIASELGQYYLDPLGQWQTAQRYYELALNQCPKEETDKRFDTRFRLADVAFYYAGEYDKARRAFESLREDLPAGDATRRRLALIRLGDIQRNQGKAAEARKLYAEAEADTAFAPKEPRAILEGRYTQEIESCLAQDNAALAQDTLDEWLWRCPTKRLSGDATVLRLRTCMMQKKYEEIRKQAEAYIAFADEPDYLPSVHALTGAACLELGRIDEARKHLEMVLEKWPESPAVKDARAALERLK